MFGSKKSTEVPSGRPASPRSNGASGTTLISKSTEICGDLKFSGSLVIEGKVTGNIVAEVGSKANLQLFDSGEVCGEIRVPMVVINGKVKGDVFASEHVELAAHAVVDGNVHYNLIEVVKGAEVNGKMMYAKPATEPVVTINEGSELDDEATDGPVITLNDSSKSIDEVGLEDGKPVVPINDDDDSLVDSDELIGLKSSVGKPI